MGASSSYQVHSLNKNVNSEDIVTVAVAAVAPITSATFTGLSTAPPTTVAPSAAASAADTLATTILRRRSIYDECVLDVPDNANVFLLTEEQRRGGSRGGYGGWRRYNYRNGRGSGPARRFHGGNCSRPY